MRQKRHSSHVGCDAPDIMLLQARVEVAALKKVGIEVTHQPRPDERTQM